MQRGVGKLHGHGRTLQVVDMSAYTESRGDREKHRWSMPDSLRSNHIVVAQVEVESKV